ncbi:MAG: hypothetical protein PQ612_04720 [Rickettsiales bacterium]|nr:hypothetical protein [Pseudomonadota bacterium]MDA0966324.1 hypothetical protein [Pseudomonadota bacterium]MDG4543956.1 hypothetical protein [Rickettsiales bacterium]MDG4545450.1 hypothetical protein [Rickettsiales bacterium]MDG4547899.1 hypothetical protein [Rickettsiales bacterium]
MLNKIRTFSVLFLLSTVFAANTSYAQETETVEESDATAQVAEIGDSDIEVTSFNVSTIKSNVAEGSKLEIEFMVSNPSYKVLSMDAEKSKINSIFVYDKPPRDILKESRERAKIEEEKLKEESQKEQRGIFYYTGCLTGDGCKPELLETSTRDGNLYINYKNNIFVLESMRNLWVKADFYVMAASEGAEEGKALIKDVSISNTVPSKISNELVSFSILANGNYKSTVEGGTSYGFNITESNKHVKSMQVVSLEDETVLSSVENIGNSFYLEEQFLGKPITLAVKYYDLSEYNIKFNQYLINN